jgi:hypothetical protein
MIYYGDKQDWMLENKAKEYQEENERLTRLLARAINEAERWKKKAKELSKRDELLAAEQSSEILEVPGYLVRELCDRRGLKYTLIGNRRFYRRSVIEKLKTQLYQEAQGRA